MILPRARGQKAPHMDGLGGKPTAGLGLDRSPEKAKAEELLKTALIEELNWKASAGAGKGLSVRQR